MKNLFHLVSFLLMTLSTLPAMAGIGEGYGIITVSVTTLHSEADFSSEPETQALLGTPVRVLDDKSWYQVQTPEDYKAWAHHKVVHLVSKAEMDAWNAAEKIVVTAHYAICYSLPNVKAMPVSDLVAGNRLKLIGSKGKFFQVEYPDGRQGYVEKKVAQKLDAWRSGLKTDPESILQTAYSLLGIPYMWAAMSTKGADCSGFVRTVLFLHDIIIPRNASQQAVTGERIEIAPDFSNLKPGDLVFFGRKATAEQKERVVHVGISMGGAKFIHSQGDVHISSFNKSDAEYDEYNLGRLLFACRVLPYINKQPELTTTATNKYYAEDF